MAERKKRGLSVDKKAELLLAAQNFRRRFFRDQERFNPVRVIEHCLPLLYPALVTDVVDKIDVDGHPAEAAVTFDKGILLEVTEATYLGALECIQDKNFSMRTLRNAPHLFTLAHEISHILLHTKACQKKAKQLARGVPGSGTSFRSNPRQEMEANVFAGGLMIPIDVVTKDVDIDTLRIRYRVSYDVAARIITQRKEIEGS